MAYDVLLPAFRTILILYNFYNFIICIIFMN